MRNGTEQRLHGLWSAGVGGHIDEPDRAQTLSDTIRNGMFRELSEELSDFDKDKFHLHYLGMINEIESEVGKVHLGIVFIADCAAGYEPHPAAELKNMQWKSVNDIKSSNTELWTKLAFMLIEE
jgi:predicted NUDIX family phosphoesterase